MMKQVKRKAANKARDPELHHMCNQWTGSVRNHHLCQEKSDLRIIFAISK